MGAEVETADEAVNALVAQQEAKEKVDKGTVTETNNLNWEVLDGLFARLLDGNSNNDYIGRETDFITAVNSAEEPFKTQILERYGIENIDGLVGLDQDNKLDIDELVPKAEQKNLTESLKRLSTIIETGKFEEFKTAIGKINTKHPFLIKLGLKSLGFEFKKGENLNTFLEGKNAKKAFEEMQKNSANKEVRAVAASEAQKEVLKGTNIGAEQLAVLNPVCDIDMRKLFEEAGNNKDNFISLLSDKYFKKIEAYHKANKKTATSTEKKTGLEAKTKQMKEIIEKKIESQVNGLPLVIRNLLDDEQQKNLVRAMNAGNALPEGITKEKIKSILQSKLTGVDIKENLPQALRVLEEANLKKEEREFLIAKMETVEGTGYEDTKRVEQYKKYVLNKGPIALDFPDWIDQQKISLGERIGALLRKIFGPFLKMIRDFRGDDKEEKPTKLDELIKKVKKPLVQAEKEAKEQKDTELAVEGLMNRTEWTGVNIENLYKIEEDDYDRAILDKRKNYFTENPVDIVLMNKILDAEAGDVLGIARTKGFDFATLKKIDENKDDIEEKNGNLKFEETSKVITDEASFKTGLEEFNAKEKEKVFKARCEALGINFSNINKERGGPTEKIEKNKKEYITTMLDTSGLSDEQLKLIFEHTDNFVFYPKGLNMLNNDGSTLYISYDKLKGHKEFDDYLKELEEKK